MSTIGHGKTVLYYVIGCTVLMLFVTLHIISSSFQNPTHYLTNQTAEETGKTRSLSGRLLRWTDYVWNSNTSRLFRLIDRTQADVRNVTTIRPFINVLGNPLNSSQDERQTACESCFVHNFKYIINNENICKVTGEAKVDLFVFIMTVHQNIQARNAVRETWMSPFKNNTGNVRYAFLLGEVTDEKLRQSVIEEDAIHHDLIKEDFVDVYSNLTYKTLMGFKWASERCAHVPYIMKTDDDMFVNIPKLLSTLNSFGEEKMKSTVIGMCHKAAAPIRNTDSKWFASIKSYPQKEYPGFCSGTGYATSLHVAKKIYEISPSVPFFHLEDVYTAICIRKLNFTLTPTPGFHSDRPGGDGCAYKANIITAHYISPQTMYQIWKKPC